MIKYLSALALPLIFATTLYASVPQSMEGADEHTTPCETQTVPLSFHGEYLRLHTTEFLNATLADYTNCDISRVVITLYTTEEQDLETKRLAHITPYLSDYDITAMLSVTRKAELDNPNERLDKGASVTVFVEPAAGDV